MLPVLAGHRLTVGLSATLLAVPLLTTPAHASAGQSTVHGCQVGHVCAYLNPDEFKFGRADLDKNTVFADDPGGEEVHVSRWDSGQAGRPADVVNNSDSEYTSEGNFVLELGGLLCVYVPDPQDEQAPGTVQTNADTSTSVSAVAVGPTAASVDSVIIAPLDACD